MLANWERIVKPLTRPRHWNGPHNITATSCRTLTSATSTSAVLVQRDRVQRDYAPHGVSLLCFFKGILAAAGASVSFTATVSPVDNFSPRFQIAEHNVLDGGATSPQSRSAPTISRVHNHSAGSGKARDFGCLYRRHQLRRIGFPRPFRSGT